MFEHPIQKARAKLLSHWLMSIDDGDREDEARLLDAKRRLDRVLKKLQERRHA